MANNNNNNNNCDAGSISNNDIHGENPKAVPLDLKSKLLLLPLLSMILQQFRGDIGAGGAGADSLSSSRRSSQQHSPPTTAASAAQLITTMLTRNIQRLFLLLCILALICALKMHWQVTSSIEMLRNNGLNADENLPWALARSKGFKQQQSPATTPARLNQALAAAAAAKKKQGLYVNHVNNIKNNNSNTPLPTVSWINSTKYTMSNTNVPFVYMVFKRVDYLQRAMESLAQSDYPKERLPVIISHDGHVPDVVDYVETLKRSNGGVFDHIIQLFHPHSCYEHPNTFPANDTTLNQNYTGGDWYGNARSHWATCCKHHFTWMLNQVFQINNSFTDYYSTTDSHRTLLNNVDTFLFTEEDYLVAPNVYSAIVAGLNVMDSFNDEVPGGGFLGLGLDPTNNGNVKKQTAKEAAATKAAAAALNITAANAPWKADAFRTGPMTLNRRQFAKIKDNAHAHYAYCTFDDYNWDWSLEHLTRKKYLPYAVLMPGAKLVQHIGNSDGMHAKNNLKPNRAKALQDAEAAFINQNATSPLWTVNQRIWDNVTITPPKKINPGNGGWGHAADHSHCLSLFQW